MPVTTRQDNATKRLGLIDAPARRRTPAEVRADITEKEKLEKEAKKIEAEKQTSTALLENRMAAEKAHRRATRDVPEMSATTSKDMTAPAKPGSQGAGQKKGKRKRKNGKIPEVSGSDTMQDVHSDTVPLSPNPAAPRPSRQPSARSENPIAFEDESSLSELESSEDTPHAPKRSKKSEEAAKSLRTAVNDIRANLPVDVGARDERDVVVTPGRGGEVQTEYVLFLTGCPYVKSTLTISFVIEHLVLLSRDAPPLRLPPRSLISPLRDQVRRRQNPPAHLLL